MIPLLFALMLAQDKAVVEGVVVNAVTNEPVKKARVILNLDGETSLEVLSGHQGKFRFEGFVPELYQLLAERQGFLDDDEGWIEISAGEQVKGVVVRITPQSAIAGQVLDEDGDPVPGAGVLVERTIHIDVGAIALDQQKRVADEEGYFFAGALRAGRYRITVTPPAQESSKGPEEDLVRTEDPIPVDLGVGAIVRSVEVRMRRGRVFQIHGRVSNWPSRGIRVELIPVGAFAQVEKGDTFTFHSVAPGDYFLSDSMRRSCPVPVTVVDHDVDNPLEFTPLAAIAGTIKMEGGGHFAEAPIVTFRTGSVDPVNTTEIAKQDGSFAATGLRPAKYALDFNPPDGYYIKSVKFNRQPVPSRMIDLTSCLGGTLEIVVAPNAATVAVTVPNAKSVKVTLWSESTLKTDQTSDGTVSFSNLAPGEYRVLAWERVNDEYLKIPEFLDRFDSQRITVTEGARESVEVKLIPQSVSDAEVAKLQ